MTQRVLTLVALTVIVPAVACSRRRPPVVPPVTASREVVTDDRASADSIARVAAMRDSLERIRIAREAARPVCTASDESCWTRNRRDEFESTAGADAIAIR